MARSKKNYPPEREIIAPGIHRINTGKGITRRSRIDAEVNVASQKDVKRYPPEVSWDHPFERQFDKLEKEAKKILEDANLPTDAKDTPEGKGFPPPKTWFETVSFIERSVVPPDLMVGLRNIAESRGYLERVDREWYAAAFLDALALTRWAVRMGDASFAAMKGFGLGVLANEFRIRFEIIADVARKGGKLRGMEISKKREAVKNTVLAEREKLQKHSDRSAANIISQRTKIPLGTVRGILQRAKKTVD